jgi:nitroreductase
VHLNLTADELLSTTRAVRKRLDFERPVEREVIEECLALALQAPTASNMQHWHWVFVSDPEKKAAIAEVYLPNFNMLYRDNPQVNDAFGPDDLRTKQRPAVSESAGYLADNFARVPWMMIPCVSGRFDGADPAMSAAMYGSLLPAVWSFMLAGRERGLGSAWTTLHLIGDGERKVADIVGIPFDHVTQGGLFPVAYTIGTDFKPAKRIDSTGLVHWERW